MSRRDGWPSLIAPRPGHRARRLAVLGMLWVQLAPPAMAGPQPAAVQAAPGQPVDAQAFWQAARQQAQGDAQLQQAWSQWCSPRAVPSNATLAVQRLQDAELSYRAERAQPVPDVAGLRKAVVLRNCAAHHAQRLQAASSYPLWLYSTVEVMDVRPGPAGVVVRARARTAQGPVVNSRITLSRGLHHACFALTDARGEVLCTLVDTHPHAAQAIGWDSAHDGPLVATLAGSMTADRVELPAVARRELPNFSTSAFLR